MDGDRIEATVTRQKAAVAERRLRFGLEERKGALAHLRQTIERRERDIVEALRRDFGKPEPEVILTEILPVLQEIRHTMRHLKRWMRERRVAPTLATLGTSARIRPEPRGLCLIIAPWNYPFNLALGPLVSALAAGNSAVVKPSEMTPATSQVIADIIEETFPPDLVAVVQGGREVSQQLLDQPFDHIFFTGSPEVGKIVMAAAARHLSSVTLELGGKSPTIVGPGADLDKAARWIAFGKFVNAGPTTSSSIAASRHAFQRRCGQRSAMPMARIRRRAAIMPASSTLTTPSAFAACFRMQRTRVPGSSSAARRRAPILRRR